MRRMFLALLFLEAIVFSWSPTALYVVPAALVTVIKISSRFSSTTSKHMTPDVEKFKEKIVVYCAIRKLICIAL